MCTLKRYGQVVTSQHGDIARWSHPLGDITRWSHPLGSNSGSSWTIGPDLNRVVLGDLSPRITMILYCASPSLAYIGVSNQELSGILAWARKSFSSWLRIRFHVYKMLSGCQDRAVWKSFFCAFFGFSWPYRHHVSVKLLMMNANYLKIRLLLVNLFVSVLSIPITYIIQYWLRTKWCFVKKCYVFSNTIILCDYLVLLPWNST